MREPPLKVSYSKVNTYQRCPLKYRLQYRDQVPVEKPIVMHLGSAVHAALKLLHDPRNAAVPMLDAVVHEFDTQWQQLAADRREYEARRDDGRAMLESYYARLEQWRGRAVLAVEKWFSFVLDGAIEVVGFIDRIDRLPDDRIELVDYKTGRYLPSAHELKGDLQFAIYALAAQQMYPGCTARAQLYALQHDLGLRVDISADDLTHAGATIRRTVTGIETESFPARPGRQCDSCEYRPVCPYWAPVEAQAAE